MEVITTSLKGSEVVEVEERVSGMDKERRQHAIWLTTASPKCNATATGCLMAVSEYRHDIMQCKDQVSVHLFGRGGCTVGRVHSVTCSQ